MANPLITIGIPVYNEEKYIAATIESAITQSYQNIRILISDNCSTDSSFEIIKEFAARDGRITYIRHEKNIGAPQNFKYLLDQADTEYFCWLGGHDVFHSNYIAAAIEVLSAQKNVVMTYPICRFVDTEGGFVDINGDDDWDTTNLPFEEKLHITAQKLITCLSIHGVFRTKVLKKIPFKRIIAFDYLMLFATAVYGNVKKIEKEYMFVRVIRKETRDEVLKRYIEQGVFKDDGQNPYIQLVYQHYLFLLKHLNLLYLRRNIRIFKKLEVVFQKRFYVQTEEIKQRFKLGFWKDFFAGNDL
jgi:glycosyltransferase involved in cell wall biosynthesis